MKKFWLFWLLPLALFGIADAIDYAPWYGKQLEIETCLKQTYQHYPQIRRKHHAIEKPSDNFFTGANAEIALLEYLKVAAELDFAKTRHMSYNFEDFRLSIQTRPLNDIVLDPVSLNLAVTLTFPTQLAVHDISLFHAGLYEGEVHVSLGKEQSCENFWTSRVWTDLALGIANRGSPWFRAQVTYEKNAWDQHRYRAQIEFLQGFGSRNVPYHHFRGWGNIHFTAVDLKAAYFHLLPQGELGLEVAYRPYAYNFPAQAASIQIRYSLPFGI